MDAKTMVKWYRGEVRCKLKRDENGLIAGKEVTDKEGRTYTVTEFTNQVEFEDMGYIKKLVNRAQRLKDDANLGARFNNRTFENFKRDRNEEAFRQCFAYAEREDLFMADKNSLMILGSVGTGKTHLAASIANRVVSKGIPTQFGTFIDYLESIRMEFDAVGRREELQRLKTTMLLVIDDLGKEKRSEWTQQILFDIVNYRYEHKLPIVITSNLNPNELEACVGHATYSRLHEISHAVIMNGDDYRQR